MSFRVCVITGTRADYGLLKHLLFRLKNNVDIDLDLVVTGSHLSDAFGNTQQEIVNDGFKEYSKVAIPIDDDTKAGMAYTTGKAMCSFAEYFSWNTPHLLVVLGDRFEILSAVIAARLLGIPVAHISGGDVTEGAIDDSIRHSITKMSQLHFPGCEQSRKRIIQMGEQPSTVFNVGEPGVENCLKTNIMRREELAESCSFPGILQDFCIVTFHPVTIENNTGVRQVEELINAMDSFSNMNYIITMANADAGGRSINELWIKEGKKHNNWLVISSLGVHRYLSAMHYSKAVIGNSSSGIVEAPSMGIPTVNIGDRQKGRMISESVITCVPNCEDIKRSMGQVLSSDFQDFAKHVKSPFGDGTTSEKIENELIVYLKALNHQDQKKKFYDIDFNVSE